jgi:hypothetical protein
MNGTKIKNNSQMAPVDLATAVEERNISQLDIKLQERRLNMS